MAGARTAAGLRRSALIARAMIAGRMSRGGASTNQAIRMNASIATGSYSAAVNTRSTYGLMSFVDNGGVPFDLRQ